MPSSNTKLRALLVVPLFVSVTLFLNAQSNGTAIPAGHDARIHRIEVTAADISIGEHEPPLRLSLEKLMELYKVPALSIAVIQNFQIVWAKGYGVIETGSATPVTPQTLFQAGSISKPVAATGALFLVEQGKLSLDEDVNRRLTTWK